MTESTTINRHLSLEGSANFRDLGGLSTADGRRVRAGRLFRSDALHRLTASDLDVLDGIGVATLIDLRSDDELREGGPSPLLDRGTRHLHLPVLSSTTAPAAIGPEMTLAVLYGQMLERGDGLLRALFEALVAEEYLPAVIHCAAGKDRTGVVTAIVLRALGVPDITIVEDYALTDPNMIRLVELSREAGHPLSRTQVPEHFMRALPQTMEAMLATLDETYGSTDAYLSRGGVDARLIAAVRDALLEPLPA